MISTQKKYTEYILWIIVFGTCVFLNEKYKIILFPSQDMVGYQFNLFTISSVLAGFSFTVLGMLLGMFSEKMMDKIKETSIVTRKCKKVANSLLLFCVSGFVSLCFIVRLDIAIERIFIKIGSDKAEFFINGFFLLGIICLFLGIVYFLISVYEIYGLIKSVYGYNKKKRNMNAEFWDEVEAAKKRNKLKIHDTERDIFTKE